MVVVGVVVPVAVADGRGGCEWCWVVFLRSGIYYFIVGDILFYYRGYIILLSYLYYFIVLIAKIDSLLQHVCRYNR